MKPKIVLKGSKKRFGSKGLSGFNPFLFKIKAFLEL